MLNTYALTAQLAEKANCTKEETEYFISFFKSAEFQAGDFLIKPGFVAKSRIHILQGVVKSYIPDEKMKENIINLAVANEWVNNFESYLQQKPCTFFVAAVERSEILLLDYMDEQKLKIASNKFEMAADVSEPPVF